MVDANGTQVHRIVDANPGDIFEYGYYANVSPDGTKIVYSTCEFPTEGDFTYSERENYNYEIAVINLDGTEQRRLTENHTFEHYPVWSPDGSRIAYLSGDPAAYELELHTMAADGTDARLVSETLGPVSFAPPVWSSDGEHLAVLASHEDGVHLFMVRVDGSKVTPIAEAAVVDKHYLGPPILPSWSPDGQCLAFVMANEEGVSGGVYTVRPDGTDLRLVLEPQTPQGGGIWNVHQVSWSPDGSALLIVFGQQLFVVKADGEVLHDFEIPEFLGGVWSHRAWRRVAWSPDSTRIAIFIPGLSYDRRSGLLPQLLHTVARDGTDRRELVLMRGYLVAANSDYRDTTKDIAACSEGFVVSQPQENPGLVQDCQTLLVMRDRLSGGTIWNWRAEIPITEWWGVEIGGSPPRVVGLKTYSFGGIIPPEIGNLIHLEMVSFIGYKESFPVEMGKLVNLRVLYAVEHQIDGSFADFVPLEMGELTNLQGLELRLVRGERLTGCVPAELPEIWVEASYLERCAN